MTGQPGIREVHVATTPQGARLAGAKAPSYVRAVNEVEARSSGYTARYMLTSDVAYVLTAAEMNLTPAESAKPLLEALLALIDDLDAIDTTTPPGDIVAQREAWMREKVGAQHAAWLHLGRNRGESLRAYLPRLYFRHVLYEQRRTVAGMLRVLVEKAEPVLEAVAPNYHHLQHSGFGTLGEYLLSWVPVFLPHLERLEQVEQRLDYGPSVIGARKEVHALYDKVSRRLGFSRRAWLRRDGIWVHSQFTEPFFALSLVAVDIARMAQDMRIWMTPEFGFFVPADEHSGGSSALPHAKVPFGFQAVIGGAILAANRLAGEMSAAAAGPSEGSEPIYHSGSLYEAAADIVARTRYMSEVIEHGRFDLEELKRKSTTDYAGSSEAHDRLVYDYGVPFRTGHRLLGAMARAHYLGEEQINLKQALLEETGRDIDVDQDEIMDIVLGRRLWPTTFDFDGLRALWTEFGNEVAAAEEKLAQPGPVERTLEALLAEARTWLARQGEP